MRTSTLLLALPAAAMAQQQIPFLNEIKGFFNKASASISSAVNSASSAAAVNSAANPIFSGAAKAGAALTIHELTLANHKTLLSHHSGSAPGLDTWQIFVTGGNKTCFGMCEYAETTWNESVVLVSAAPTKKAPNFARLDCETDNVLCHAWALGPPQIMHVQLPQPLADQSAPATTVRYLNVNRTSVTAPELAALTLEDKYLDVAPYEGVFHPFDGPLAKYGAAVPFGHVVATFSLVPSWVFMILVSFVSRNFMSRRLGPQAGAARPAGAAAPAAAAQ